MKKINIILISIMILTSVTACFNSQESNSTVETSDETDVIVETSKKSEAFIIGNEEVFLENIYLLDNKVEILMPKSFKIMSEELAKIKYPSENRPNIIYMNEEGSINIAFTYTSNKITSEELESYKEVFIESFNTLYPSAIWYENNILLINEKLVGFLELLTPAIDTEIYNLMFFTELDGRLLIGTFNCTEDEMEYWESIAKEIMNSIKIN